MCGGLNDMTFEKILEEKNKMELTKATSGNVVKLEETGATLSGWYESCTESALYGDSFAFSVRDATGSLITTFVNHIVFDLLEKNRVQKGKAVKLVYLGKIKAKGSGMMYKNYELYYEK